MTYESERSSMFNENINNIKDDANRNNIGQIYSKPAEQQKRAPVEFNCKPLLLL